MKPKKKIITFIKAIDKQYFDSFINEGQVCMNTIKWFREYEKYDSNIGDEFEGARMVCGKDFTISIADPITEYNSEEELNEKLKSSKWKKLGKGINLKQFDESDNANILSLYAITTTSDINFEGYLVPQKFAEEFTNHRFVIILEPMIFISRMKSAIFEFNKSFKHGLVNYYTLDENFVENLLYFAKPEKYSYQSEFRLVVEDPNAVQRIFKIGSLKEICLEIDINKEYVFSMINETQFSIKQKN
ncbi:MAG: hypothetical protein JZU53_13425 [Paludibacter sp.]|nr:hypothetical protein [Paludibacter sp.]